MTSIGAKGQQAVPESGGPRRQRISMVRIIETVKNVGQLLQKFARQVRADILRVMLEHGDEIIEAARKDKSIKPSELRQLKNFVKIMKAAKDYQF
jgi:hypothetical protein